MIFWTWTCPCGQLNESPSVVCSRCGRLDESQFPARHHQRVTDLIDWRLGYHIEAAGHEIAEAINRLAAAIREQTDVSRSQREAAQEVVERLFRDREE
jgi:hypothetical protein